MILKLRGLRYDCEACVCVCVCFNRIKTCQAGIHLSRRNS